MRDPKVLALTALVTAMVGIWAVAGCSGLNDRADGGPYFTINMKGGNGGLNGGYGGYGGDFDQYFYYGSGANVEIRQNGVANAFFQPTWMQANLGPIPYVFATSQTVAYYPGSEPAAGTVYIYDGNLYLSDGDGTPYEDEECITGFRVNPGVTVTFDGAGSGVTFYLDNDVENLGTITTLDGNTDYRDDLSIYCADWLSMGTVDLKGNGAGQDGGSLYVWASFGITNHGPVWTYGAAAYGAGYAGHGGSIEFISAQFTENTGDLLAYGGAGTGPGGYGGDGGEIDLETDDDQTCSLDLYVECSAWGDVRNSGRLHSYGGLGAVGGGCGGDVEFESYYSGLVMNSGEILAYGGNSSDYYGGCGGGLDVYSDGGNIVNSGAVDLHGGSTETTMDGYGGSAGGDLYVYTYTGEYEEPTYGYPQSGGGITWSGNINTAGGNAPATAESASYGGNGGDVEFEADACCYPYHQPLQLLGYGQVDTRGGDANWPGWGGYFYQYNEYAYGDCCEYSVHGVVNEAAIDTRGGNVSKGSKYAAPGGYGGSVDMYMYYDYATNDTDTLGDAAAPKVFNCGTINTSGGDGWHMYGGTAGYVWLYARDGLANLAPVTARGGSDYGTADDGYGGYGGTGGSGGEVSIHTDRGECRQIGDIDQRGGDGATGGGLGGTPYEEDYPTLGSNDNVWIQGNIYANGGNGGPYVDACGGNGGFVWIYTSKGPTAINHYGACFVEGGKGTIADQDGEDGFVVKGGFLVQGTIPNLLPTGD